MSVSTRIGYRARPNDEKLLLMLAEHLERDNLSDVLRFAVRFTARSYGLLPAKKPLVVRKIKQQEAKP